MFISTYGFSKSAYQKPQPWNGLVHKALCADKNAEIYEIGTISIEQRLSEKIYILIWEDKIIPFVLPSSITITEKEITHYKEHNGREYLLARYNIPVKSVLVKDIGKDLLKLPRGRDHNAYYDRQCFPHEDRHYHAFENKKEYEEAVGLIKSGLPVLLYDQYDAYAYNPMIAAEFVVGTGPWNFEDELYQKEIEAQKRHYDSEYRQCHSIDWNLERARKNRGKKDAELKKLKENSKRFPVLESANKTRFAMNKKAKKAANTCMKEFKRNVKSLEDFFEFLRVRPSLEKNDIKEITDSEGNVKRIATFRSAIQGQEDWETFLELLVTSDHSVLNEFEKYKAMLHEQAASEAEKHLPTEKKERYDFNGARDKLKQFSSENTTFFVEEIMAFLIGLERQFHAEYGSSFDTRILQEPAFIDLVKKSYKQHYSEICSSYESLLVCITKAMTTRINYRVARERADKEI